MKGQHTHFQAHQHLAKRNSRRLSIAFLLCVFLSAGGYLLVSLLFFRGMYGSSTQFAFTIGLVLGGVCVITILMAYYLRKKRLEHDDAGAIAILLGAEELPYPLTLPQQRYRNVVEEMAVASGITLPEMLFLPNDDSINAFVVGGKDKSVAVAVSNGALDYLSREELQAIIAHEFGHIANEDVFLNNRLTAVLFGFFCIRSFVGEWLSVGLRGYGDRYRDDDDDQDWRGFFIGLSLPAYLLAILFYLLSWLMIFFGQLLQAAFSRQREWLADAHAVQYTRNSAALVGVFQKALALQQMKVRTPHVAGENAHRLFINYQSWWLSTHPPLKKRLQRYGNVPFANEMQAIIYQLKQRKHDNQRLERERYQADIPIPSPPVGNGEMVTDSGIVLSLNQDTNYQQNPAAVLSDNVFVAEKFYPLLIIKEYQQQVRKQQQQQHAKQLSVKSALAAVLAHFVRLGNQSFEVLAEQLKWRDSLADDIKTHVETLTQQHPITHIDQFISQLSVLSHYADKPTLIKHANAVINADNAFNFSEMCYLLCLHHYLGGTQPQPPKNQHLSALQAEIIHLLNVVAVISQDNHRQQQALFERLLKHTLPKADPTLLAEHTPEKYAVNTPNNQRLFEQLIDLSRLRKAHRRNVVRQIEKQLLLSDRLSVEQNELLTTLKILM